MKKGLEILESKLKLRGLNFKFVANIHDEWQIEVPEAEANNIGDLAVLSLREAGDYFEMRCPLDGEYKIGGNWSETH